MVTGYSNWFHANIPSLHPSKVIMKIAFRLRWHANPSCHFDGSHHLERQTAALDYPCWKCLPFGWVVSYLVHCVPKSAAHSSTPSRFNSLLFQLDFLITGNFPLKEISTYAYLLLMCFSSLFLSLCFIVKMKQGQSLPFLTRTTLAMLSKIVIPKTRRMEYISHWQWCLFFTTPMLFLQSIIHIKTVLNRSL